VSDIGLHMKRRGSGTRPRRRRRGGAGCLAVLLSLVVLGGIAAFVVVQGQAWLEDRLAPPPDYEGDGAGSVLVQVEEGDTSTQIAQSLHDAGVVASEEAFVDAARQEPRATLIQVGFYDMNRRMSAESALERLLDPDSVVTSALTVPEGLTAEETLDRAAEETDLRRRGLRRAARSPERLGLPGYADGELEGYLFPATYELPPNVEATGLLRTMVERFEESAARLDLERGAQELDLSPHEIVTVASIVQREARRPEDFAKVARVIYNRLEQDMLLQMDSTVHYAVGKTGQVATTDEDRASRSPYNTYRSAGLPPGPIAAPGDDALEAALDPAEGDWIYFVTVDIDTGETKFAETDSEHQRNVAELREFCRQSPKC
jgi:UPF0755 protein